MHHPVLAAMLIIAFLLGGTPCSGAAGRLHGIIWLAGMADRFGDDAELERFLPSVSANLAANPVDGVYLAIRWDDLETRKNEYRWHALDAVVRCVRSSGKFYKLVLDPGVDTPAYVYDEGAIAFPISEKEAKTKSRNREDRIPLPWDEVFQTNFIRVLTAIAERYGSDPAFAATAITGVSHRFSETHLPKDVAAWKRYDGYEAKIKGSLLYYIDSFARIFPDQMLCYEIAVPFSGMETALRESVAYAVEKYPQRISLQNNQLNGKGDNERNPTYRIINEYKDRVMNGFQNVSCLTEPCASSDGRQGSLAMTISNYIKAGAEYLEVWYIDGMTRSTLTALTEAIDEGYGRKK